MRTNDFQERSIPKHLYSLIVICLLLTGCDKGINIHYAKYLDDIFPNSDGQQTFIVKSHFWNRPTCGDIEQWSKENIEPVNYQKIYNFLEYDKNITYDNQYLKSEYDAIRLDYLVCQMYDDDRQCFNCEE